VGAAWLDRAPVVALTCNVPTAWLERRIQMRIDHHTLFRPLTKASFALKAESVGATLAQAIDLACDEPPGPVHLDLPEDVGTATAVESPAGGATSRSPLPDLADAVAEQLTAALGESRRPLLVTGLDFTRSRQAERLLRFIETQRLPFATTLHAKGFLPESHPNWAGVIGRARRSDVQEFVRRADLIVAVGYDPIEINYEEWVGPTPVVHISTEPIEAGPEVTVRLDLAGDLDSAIRRMGELPAAPNDWSSADFAEHRRKLDAALRPESVRLVPHQVLDLVREALPADGILAYDVGAHTHQIATQWRTDRPYTHLATNGWSSMGFGMPAAYAAKLVHRELPVVGVVGDGCFQMTAGELAVARRLNLAVPIVVLNDGWLGLIKVKQERKSYRLSGVHLGEPPESPPHYFGVPVRSARNERELRSALAWGLELGGPSVIEAFIDVEEYSQTVYD
jgi:acetolactate synthase-1/2/3 large subunit